MKKILILILLNILFCKTGFAESYYFKECNISATVSGNYLIDFEKNLISVTLEASDGSVQKYTDNIKLVTEDRVVSEIIQQKNKKFATQYFLDAKSKSVIRQLYEREIAIDLIRPKGAPKKGFCANVKADWYKSEKDKEKEKESKEIEILKENLKIKNPLPKCQGTEIKKWTNCQGIYLSEDKYKYIGEWKGGRQHGRGVEAWEDGRKYIGEFQNDKRHGKGVFILPDGTKFTGQYKNGKKHGEGTYAWSNGDVYVGQFEDGKQSGKGKYTFASGKVHKGQFKDGNIIDGTAFYPDGTKYIGQFEFDQPQGQGTITYSNGGKYIGQFVDGGEYGEGICVQPGGSKNKCIMGEKNNYLGKNTYSISIIGDWHKIEEQLDSKEKLVIEFEEKASNFCALTGNGNFNILKKKVEVKETDETPAFGLNPVYKLGIDGVIKCK